MATTRHSLNLCEGVQLSGQETVGVALGVAIVFDACVVGSY